MAQFLARLMYFGNKPELLQCEADTSEKAVHEFEIISSVPPSAWEEFALWGQDTEYLEIQYQNTAREIARKLRKSKVLTDAECIRAMVVLNTVKEHNPELLGESDSD